MRRTRFAVISLWASLCWFNPEPGFAASNGDVTVADIALGVRVLEHEIQDGFAESLVRISAANHGPSDVSSYLVATCLSDPPPMVVDGEMPGGCGEFDLVAPCAEFGLGFRFGALAHGQGFQCLVRVRAPVEWSGLRLPLSASHARDANGNGLYDPNISNDLIVLSASGIPEFAPVPALSFAGLLALCGCLLAVAHRRVPERSRAS